MALIPDVDWCSAAGVIAYEETNKLLTRSLVRSPFDPVFAYVTFEFPDDVVYPCIPISVNGSLIYPRKSDEGVYASAPELYLALALGAKVWVKRLFAGNIRYNSDGSVSHSLFAVVKNFVNDRDLAQKVFGKKSLADLFLKTGVNSIYGKTAQDIIEKATYSAMKEGMVELGGPVFAVCCSLL